MHYFSIKDIVLHFLKERDISITRDIIKPAISLDKIIAYVAVFYAIKTFNRNYQLKRVDFIYQITQSHRDIWSKISEKGLTVHILDPNSDPTSITPDEERNVINVILHTVLSYEAHYNNIMKINNGILLDIGQFYNLPVPNAVWNKIKVVHQKKFIVFIEKAKIYATQQSQPQKKFSFRTWPFLISVIEKWRHIQTLIHKSRKKKR